MKGILVFDQLNDVVFMKTDDDLYHHLHSLSVKNGLIDPKENEMPHRNSLSKDAIVQLFSPLIASQRVMEAQFFNMYSTVECTDGTTMVFTVFSGYLFIGISSRQEETLSLSRRRLGVFVSLVKLLYGPAVHLLKETEMFDRRCQFLSKLLDSWECLRKKEQMFHLEAVEKLLVNNDLSIVCIKVLQKVLEKVRSSTGSEESMCHVFLLVESKLLAFYSSRNATELSKSSLLLLILLALSIQSSSPQCENSQVDSDKNSSESSKVETYFTPLTSISSDTECSQKEEISAGIEMTENETCEAELIDITGIHQMLTFLYSENDAAVPHMVHTVTISPKLLMVIVSEIVIKTGISSPLANTLDSLYEISNASSEGRHSHTIDNLEINMKRFADNVKKLKLEKSVERKSRNLINKWEQLKRNGFIDYVQDTKEQQISSRLENAVSSICEDIRKIFEEIMFLPEIDHQRKIESSLLTALLHAQELTVSKMSDYVEYLTVKAERNVSITSYIQDFPGLIHFLYIDRTRNFLTAPSINMSEHCTEERTGITNMMKGMIWKMVEFSRRYLEASHLTAMWREGDYCFSYFLWFEDSGGKFMKPLDSLQNRQLRPLPGIFCGDFYKMLTKECFPSLSLVYINCYELFAIHHANVPTATITEQMHRLALSSWEMSGVAHIPIDLL